MGDQAGGTIIASWIFASVLAQVVQHGGLIEGLLWFGLNTGAQGSIFTSITFVSAICFSMGTGTANGTILAFTPVMYPAGVFLGADPLMLALAIMSGGAVGDTLSPISASNIVSAITVGADMKAITRTRAPLVFIAAAIALVIFLVMGGGGNVSAPPQFRSMEPTGLLMLLGFVAVIGFSLLGKALIESLCYGIFVALAIGIGIGKLDLSQMLHVVQKQGASSGLIEDGVNGVVGAIIFILFVLGIVRVLIESGIMEEIVNWAQRSFIKSRRQAELAILTVTHLVTIPVSANTPCEVLLGPTFVKPIAERFGIAPERAANLLCCSVCTLFYMMPWHIVCALWYNTVTQTAAQYDIASPSITGAFALPFNWALFFVIYISAITGWGSQKVSIPDTTDVQHEPQ